MERIQLRDPLANLFRSGLFLDGPFSGLDRITPLFNPIYTFCSGADVEQLNQLSREYELLLLQQKANWIDESILHVAGFDRELASRMSATEGMMAKAALEFGFPMPAPARNRPDRLQAKEILREILIDSSAIGFRPKKSGTQGVHAFAKVYAGEELTFWVDFGLYRSPGAPVLTLEKMQLSLPMGFVFGAGAPGAIRADNEEILRKDMTDIVPHLTALVKQVESICFLQPLVQALERHAKTGKRRGDV